jgi:hypothetical protein
MRFLPPELDISETEGFTAERDIFSRKIFGESLTNIISALEGSAVLLLDAPWGVGKTTFLKMWRGELRKLGIPSIYFDAFGNDYHDDAFLTIAGELIARARETQLREDGPVKDFTDKAVHVGKALGRAAIRIGIHAATAGFINSNVLDHGTRELTEAVKTIGEDSSKAIDDLLKDALESHSKDQTVFAEFKEALATLAVTLSQESNNSAESSNSTGITKINPLVIIIDELDRCRPSFALDLIEKIKHFFSVQGVIFILSASLRQLEAAVTFSYGNIDAHAYLEKFYHMRILLPTNQPDRADRATSTYLTYLLTKEGINQNEWEYLQYVKEIIYQFDGIRSLSLRTLERISLYINIAKVATSNTWVGIAEITSILAVMKVINPELYQKARSGVVSFTEIDEFAKFSEWRDRNNSTEMSTASDNCQRWWKYILGEHLNQKDIEIMQIRFQSRTPRNIITNISNVLDGYSFPS